MATTFVEYTGDGNATKQFTFPSYQESDVKVRVDGVLKTTSIHYNITSYTTTGGGNVVFTSGNIPSSPANIRIYRDTNVDTAKATFTAGSSVKAADLNNNTTQLIYRAQEEQVPNLIHSYDIDDDAIITATIKDNAVTMAKLADGALPTDITVASANLVDGTIVNADVNASAAIDGTKVDPDFGSQNLSTTGTAATGNLTVTGTVGVSSNITVGGTVDGRDIAADGTKLDGIESGATADQTAAEIRTLTEAATDSNVFTDADHTKLNDIETGATADQTASEIRTLVGDATDSNVFTDAEKSKLSGIESAATQDQTASEIKTLLQSDKLTNAEIAEGTLDGRYFTEAESDARYFRQDSSETIASGNTWSSNDNFIATTGAINARIVDLIDDVGGFIAIDSEQHFPNDNPQGSTGQAAILSIQATSSTLTPSGTTVTIVNGNLADNANITITGVPSAIPTGFGFLVESTSTLHTYTFHRLVPKATEVTTVAGIASAISTAATNVADINNFADKYIISSNEPTQRVDGTSLQEGDLWYDSSNDNLQVYTGSAFAIITPSQSVLDDVAIVSGAITYQEDLGLITQAVSTGSSNGSLDIVADAIEDEVIFTITVSGGKFYIDGVEAPALTLYKGWTYTFDVSDSSNANHPLRFSSDGSAYNTGVTVTGTQGQAGAKVQLVVPETQPTTFIYYCTNHSGMGNSITVKDDPIKTVSDNILKIIAAADNQSNINAVQANETNINAVQANSSNINAAVSNASNINAAVSNATNINTVAGSISNVNAVGSNISNVNAVFNNTSNINSVVSNASNVNTVAGSITSVNTTAANIADVNNFTDKYQIASSNPSTDGSGNALDVGDLFFNTSANELRIWNGTQWQGGVTATGNLSQVSGSVFTGDNRYNDNVKLKLGTDSDLQIFHNTTDSIINASGTGNIKLQDQGNTKLEVTATGTTVTGLMSATTIDGSAGDNLTLDFGTIV